MSQSCLAMPGMQGMGSKRNGLWTSPIRARTSQTSVITPTHGDKRYNTKDTHTQTHTDRQARLYMYTYTRSQGIDISPLFFRVQGK